MPTKKPAKQPQRVNAGTTVEAAALRRRLFVDAYLANGHNATEAAKSAGYSPATAKVQGSRLLTNVDVRSMLAEHAEKIAHKYDLHAEMAIKSIVQEITFDPRRLFTPEGGLKRITDLDDDTAAALQAFEVTEEVIGKGKKQVVLRTAKVKWASKAVAREQAMKHLGLFKADNAQKSVLDGVPREILLAIAARLKNMGGAPRLVDAG